MLSDQPAYSSALTADMKVDNVEILLVVFGVDLALVRPFVGRSDVSQSEVPLAVVVIRVFFLDNGNP